MLQEDKLGVIPVKAIEQLANLEVRLGEEKGGEAGLQDINNAIERLDALINTTKFFTDEVTQGINVERYSLLGSAYKRMAKVWLNMKGRDTKEYGSKIEKALSASRNNYRKAEKLNHQ